MGVRALVLAFLLSATALGVPPQVCAQYRRVARPAETPATAPTQIASKLSGHAAELEEAGLVKDWIRLLNEAAQSADTSPLTRAMKRSAEQLERILESDPAFSRRESRDAISYSMAVQQLVYPRRLSPEALAFLAARSTSPDYYEAMVEHGRVLESVRSPEDLKLLEDALNLAVHQAGDVHPATFTQLLSALGKTFQDRMVAASKRGSEETADLDAAWKEKVKHLLAHFSSGGRQAFHRDLSLEVETRPALKKATTAQMADSVFLFDSPEVRSMLKQLLKQEWFTRQNDSDRSILFHHLAKALNVAASSPDPMHRELLRNTVDAIVSGRVPAYLGELASSTGGTSNTHTRVITLNRQHALGPTGDQLSRGDRVLEILGHEVSHSVSNLRLGGAPYFEEEMRAKMVGLYMATGEWPTRRQAAEHAIFLLTGNGYPEIAQAWQAAPQAFARHLNQLGLANLSLVQGEAQMKWLLQNVPNGPAPEWGWEGFRMNRPAPTSFVSGSAKGPEAWPASSNLPNTGPDLSSVPGAPGSWAQDWLKRFFSGSPPN